MVVPFPAKHDAKNVPLVEGFLRNVRLAFRFDFVGRSQGFQYLGLRHDKIVTGEYFELLQRVLRKVCRL